MKLEQLSFSAHYIRIKAEGFQQQRLLNECIKQNIKIKGLRAVNDIEMEFTVSKHDYNRLLTIAKRNYRISILSENGWIPTAKKAVAAKLVFFGIAIFVAMIYYNSLFIREIEIVGYEKFSEPQIRESLQKAGFYEGCSKDVDLDEVKMQIYKDLKYIAWIGIKIDGTRAEIEVAEGTKTIEKEDIFKPCHIVADRDAYIARATPKNGVRVVEYNQFVKKGDIIISGIMPIKSTAFGTLAEDITEKYVHAEGIAKGKVPYRFTFYAEKYKLDKSETGRNQFAINLDMNGKKLSTKNVLSTYEISTMNTVKNVEIKGKFPVGIELVKVSEVTLSKRELSDEEIIKIGNMKLREAIKENIPKNEQILNKSLNFSREKNIIEIQVMVESLQDIGVKQEFYVEGEFGRTPITQNQ